MVFMDNLPVPKIRLMSVRKIFFFVVVALGIFSVGYLVGFKGYQGSIRKFPEVTITREVPEDKGTLDFSLFWKVWDMLNTSYFDKEKLIPSNMVYGAIEGMVSALGDPYTVFLPPDKNRVVQEDLQGTFEGVGIQIGFKGNQLAVVAPIPGSPAAKAGVKAGDFIMGIKDEEKGIERGTVGISLTDAVQAIRGPAGSKVTLSLLREGSEEPVIAEITREAIDIPSVELSFEQDGKVAHIKLLKFGGETDAEWEVAVSEILKRPEVEGIVLDVRNNPGGYLQGAVDIAGEFLRTGKVVVIEERAGAKEEYIVETVGRFLNTPLVVLVNEGSASASEILAGAISDNKRGKIVGEVTFGKGTIQEPQQVNGGAGLHITIARWLTPKETWVNDEGLKPDVEVEDDPNTESDEQLQEAIKQLGF
jgi:carboxyl-terminal processing protease